MSLGRDILQDSYFEIFNKKEKCFMSTKVVTGKVRLSYCQLFEPKAINGSDPKYSVSLLIPKSDGQTVGKIQAAIKEAADRFRERNGASSLPANPMTPLHDGDGTKPNSGEPYGPECKDCWVMSCTSAQNNKPVVVDRSGQPILDASEVYSGCYGRASINFYGYSNARKGVGVGLLAVQKVADGEPFGTVGSADDFNDGWTDGEADDFLS